MNTFRLLSGAIALSLLLSISSSINSGRKRHKAPAFKPAPSTVLQAIRGTLLVDNVTQAGDGTITGVHLTATRGSGWTIANGGNAVVVSSNITPLAQIVVSPTIQAAIVLEIAFNIVFDTTITCKTVPSVLVGVEDSAPVMNSPGALITAALFESTQVKKGGFTAKAFIQVYGSTAAEANTLLFGFLTANPSIDFTAHCDMPA